MSTLDLAMNTVNIFMSRKNKKRSIFDQLNGKGKCWCFFAQATRFRDLQDFGSGSHSNIWFLGRVDTNNKSDTTGLKFKKEGVRKTCLLNQEKAVNPNIV